MWDKCIERECALAGAYIDRENIKRQIKLEGIKCVVRRRKYFELILSTEYVGQGECEWLEGLKEALGLYLKHKLNYIQYGWMGKLPNNHVIARTIGTHLPWDNSEVIPYPTNFAAHNIYGDTITRLIRHRVLLYEYKTRLITGCIELLEKKRNGIDFLKEVFENARQDEAIHDCCYIERLYQGITGYERIEMVCPKLPMLVGGYWGCHLVALITALVQTSSTIFCVRREIIDRFGRKPNYYELVACVGMQQVEKYYRSSVVTYSTDQFDIINKISGMSEIFFKQMGFDNWEEIESQLIFPSLCRSIIGIMMSRDMYREELLESLDWESKQENNNDQSDTSRPDENIIIRDGPFWVCERQELYLFYYQTEGQLIEETCLLKKRVIASIIELMRCPGKEIWCNELIRSSVTVDEVIIDEDADNLKTDIEGKKMVRNAKVNFERLLKEYSKQNKIKIRDYLKRAITMGKTHAIYRKIYDI